MLRTLVLAAAIVGGLMLNAMALNQEWWIPPEDECALELQA